MGRRAANSVTPGAAAHHSHLIMLARRRARTVSSQQHDPIHGLWQQLNGSLPAEKLKGLPGQLTRRTDAPQIEIYLRITRLMLVNSYLPIFVRVKPRGPEACARKRWLEQSAAEGRLRMLVFPFGQTISLFSSCNRWPKRILLSWCYCESLLCPDFHQNYGIVLFVTVPPPCCCQTAPPSVQRWEVHRDAQAFQNSHRICCQSINLCKSGFILQNNGHLDWCRHATRSLCAY